MTRRFLQAKVHRAIVTGADLQYEGSLTLDENLMDAAGLLPFQQIDVYNVTRGTRFTTYLIVGPRGHGDACVNGAAAHLVERGDRIIIAAYCDLEAHEVAEHRPTVVLVREGNRIFEVKHEELAHTKVASN